MKPQPHVPPQKRHASPAEATHRLTRRALETAHAAIAAVLAAGEPVHDRGSGRRQAAKTGCSGDSRRLRGRYLPAALAVLAAHGAQTARQVADRLGVPHDRYRSFRSALSADAARPDAWVRAIVAGEDLAGAYWVLTEEGRRVAAKLAAKY